ncbi:Gfo/Idh/MocA family protein [Synoicihabitans lomoniglobus]|uniref:Gfo/Idh/MocA family oxidoreductase n=1 Tax=Synoicihabitans lomoniglobus TaxID=2909285 RepID=A0AAE9ZYP7_9BACT|nr:Gfo/Idh/MocA family oxidoreductase [Opitutaceae bacterium LMO-M01]WED63673.1 Gfo/Idh/MocA family oxidoreductase [Opitutaceae bacterium LMO-M01]
MKVALLGLHHPHSVILWRTLDALPEVTRIALWNDNPAADDAMLPDGPSRAKTSPPTCDLSTVLADPALSFVVLCVRHDIVADIAQQVVAAGKHLLVEKPAGLTSHEIRALQDGADCARVTASVLYVRRHHPCVVAARKLVQAGTLGVPLSVESRFLTTQVQFRDPSSWLFQRARSGGGVLLWLGCHCLDLMQYVAGDDITAVGAMMATRSGEPIDVEDIAALTLRFRSGAVGTFHAGYTLAFSGAGYVNLTGYDAYFGYNARQGRLIWPDLESRLIVEKLRPSGESPRQEERFDQPSSNLYGGQAGVQFFRQFIAAIAGEVPPPAPLSAALRTALIVEAAETASREGRVVAVAAEPITPQPSSD